MGPDGGHGGGTVVAVSTPEDVAKVGASHTGQFLRKVLEQVGYLPPLLRGAAEVEPNGARKNTIPSKRRRTKGPEV